MTRLHRLGVIARWSALGAGAAVLGCADQATAPRTLLPDTPSRVAIGDITGPTPTNEVLRVCKVWVNHSLDAIGISWTGSATGSTTIPGSAANNIQCKVIEIQGSTAQWTITVMEDDPGANVTTSWQVISTNAANNASGTGRSATATIGGAGPEGSTIIFTNTFTPPPSGGCTLTFGYWKNHPEDWDEVGDPNTASFITTTTFYGSGLSYLEILNTAPKGGNAYIILAHQFIAAELSIGAGASTTSAVDAALTGADLYFSGASYSRDQLIAWADVLDAYNNGLIGPGHCSD